ncbi:FecR domain-containing protein [Dyadobacter sp. CY261]|uniref:FecR family protein n=1 Tax=Dyadobacter sp. CY261 TaxID=2907203 RepID=UPI001F2E2480|nr:FecR domain-containing protein [Dyadobacter sp. CY261]MCF0072808.1 FecR domain-containing protein [Dyadobacter sp. CY261]
MNRFETLLNRYLNQTASKSETAELFRLIGTGEYDDIIGYDILQAIHNEMVLPASEEEKNRMDSIYDEKLRSRIGVENVGKVRVLHMKSWLAAAAVVAGVTFGSWWFLNGRSSNESVSIERKVSSAPAADMHLAKFTDKQWIHLPDGSTVLLNNGGELTYSQDNFGKDGREVTLSGEGFFDVKHDPARPFVVHTGKIKTTVLGTAFNIATSAGKQQVRVTVTRGKVKVGDQSRTYDVITPDQQIVVNTSTNDFTKENVNARLIAGWKDRFVILDNTTMREAISIISERFNVKMALTNQKLEECHVSASFLNGEDLEHILKVLAAVNQISYTFQADGSVTLDGGTSCQ